MSIISTDHLERILESLTTGWISGDAALLGLRQGVFLLPTGASRCGKAEA